MFRTVDDFENSWKFETGATQRTLNALTDASLAQPIESEFRTLGRIAWHLTDTIKEMMERTGLEVEGAAPNTPVPLAAKEIADMYATSAKSLLEEVKENWTDETLETFDDMYGEPWSRGQTLLILVTHQAHHRGQMTVLMRQAGLTCPGIYGPAKEEWAQWGMQAPAI